MKKLITISTILFTLTMGFITGHTTAKPQEISDITTSNAGVQITYTDGTGYWYEY